MRALRRIEGITTMLPTEDAAWVGAELARRFGLPVLAVRAHGHRREPLDDPDVPPRDPPAADRRLQLVLPRLGGRVVRASSTSRASRGRGRGSWARRSIPPRPRGWRSSTTSARWSRVLEHERRGVPPDGARAHEHRDRAAGAGLHGRRARALHGARHAADHRRDAHAQRRARRVHRRVGARARRRDARQVDRRRGADRRVRGHGGAGRADRGRRRTPTTRTRAEWAARWPATRCRSRRPARRSSRCSPTTPSSG